MITRHKQEESLWIDLQSPTQEEARDAMLEGKIPPELFVDVMTPVPRSSALYSGNAIKLTIDYPVVKRTDLESPHEIKFFITKDALVTARYEDISAFYKFSTEFEVLSILGKAGSVTSGHLFAALMRTLYEALSGKLEYLETQLQTIEQCIFDNEEKEMVFAISKVNRKLIVFKQTLIAHGDVMHDAEPYFIDLFGKPFAKTLGELREYYDHLMRHMSTLSESAIELRETNQVLLGTKQSEIMKTLTVMTFVGFPLSIIASLFSTNARNTPFIGEHYDFLVIIGIMSATALCLSLYFKIKRWF